MAVPNITNLESLLHLDETKVVAKTIEYLTAVGDNYGSLILKVDVRIQTSDGFEDLHLVAKTFPLNEQMQEMFNSKETFRNEIAAYRVIIPTLQDFQREHGVLKVIDFAAKYHGSRPNLHGLDSQLDNNAVLLLENLKPRGFFNFERTVGLDLDTTKLVLENLARFHAVPLALKLKRPEVFKTKISPYLRALSFSKETLNRLQMSYNNIVRSLPQLEAYMERLSVVSVNKLAVRVPREPFATVYHNDCWVNNVMVRLDETGKPTETKLIDFQVCNYGSPANDIIFLLFSSVQNEILTKYCDQLIQFYYQKFTHCLTELKVDLTQFSFAAFLNDLAYEARDTQFLHIVLMLFVIFAPKKNPADLATLKPEDIWGNEPTELHKNKLVFVVDEFAKRNWI